MVKDAFTEDHLFSEHTDRVSSEMGDAERLAWQRLTRSLRRCVEAAVDLSASTDEIEAACERADALADELAALARGRGIALFGGGAESEPEAVSAGVPFSPVMGQLNPVAPPLVLRRDGDRVVGDVTLGKAYQGAPGLVHGAVVSAMYDEVLALANTVNGASGATGRLTIHFRAPTPLDTPLRFEAWTDRIDARKVFAGGRCFAGDRLLTEAEGLFIRVQMKI